MAKFERKEKSQPKHKPAASSGASKAPRPPPVQQPGWKGPTYLHKKPARPPKPASSPAAGGSDAGPTLQPQVLPAELQQLVLDVFRDTFPASLDFDALKPTLQEVNVALSERDFETALGTEAFREAYAIRWSPSRALCYANLLAHIMSSVASDEPWVTDFLYATKRASRRPHRAVCIGGGASELMAFGALLRHLRRPNAAGGKPSAPEKTKSSSIADQAPSTSGTDSGEAHAQGGGPCPLHLTLVDTASWSSVVAKLARGLTTPPALSKYASATARANNASLIGAEAMRTTCIQADIHGASMEELRGMVGPDAALFTLFFTLNDLYTASIAKTTKFLVELSLVAPRDSLLLVVDSVGAYAEPGAREASGKGGKRYAMDWLLDHLLLNKGKTQAEDGEEVESSEPVWDKLMGDECRLFRLEEGLRYPASLENMRFQVHLFRRH